MVRISESDWYILNELWRNGSMTLPDLVRALAKQTGWSKNVIATMLKRMQQKGTVTLDASGALYRYFPAIDRQETITEQMQAVVERMFEGKPSLLVSSMVASGTLTESDIAEMLACLRAAGQEKRQ